MKFDLYRFGIIFIAGLLLLSACNTAQATSTQPTLTSTRATGQNRTSAANSTGATPPTRVRATTAAPTATETPQSPTTTPELPTATATPPTQPTPTVGAEGMMTIPDQRQTINFAADSSSYAEALTLPDQTPEAYQFEAAAGQNLYLTVAGTANIQVFSPSLLPLTPIVVMPGLLNIQLPESGSYILVLQGLRRITFNVYLTTPDSNPASGAPLTGKIQAVTIPVLPYSINLDTRLDPTAPMGYSFDAQAGQKMGLTMTGDVAPVVIAPDGNTLVPDPDLFSGKWNFSLIESGQYSLVLAGNGVVAVKVQMTAPSAVSLPDLQPGSGERIVLPEGETAINLRTSFISGKSQTFVLNAPARHQMIITVTGNAGVVQILGPDQKPVSVIHSQIVPTWSVSLEDVALLGGGGGARYSTLQARALPSLGLRARGGQVERIRRHLFFYTDSQDASRYEELKERLACTGWFRPTASSKTYWSEFSAPFAMKPVGR